LISRCLILSLPDSPGAGEGLHRAGLSRRSDDRARSGELPLVSRRHVVTSGLPPRRNASRLNDLIHAASWVGSLSSPAAALRRESPRASVTMEGP